MRGCTAGLLVVVGLLFSGCAFRVDAWSAECDSAYRVERWSEVGKNCPAPARRGDPEARAAMAEYLSFSVLRYSLVEARAWALLAAEGGDGDVELNAREVIERLDRKLTKSEVERSEELAKLWGERR